MRLEMCNCYTFENPGKNPNCKQHNNFARWFRTTCYGSDYYWTTVKVIGEVNENRIKVQTADKKYHTVEKRNIYK
jgi:hypothetical protein